MLTSSETNDPFVHSRMSFEDHIGELALRLRRAIAVVAVVTVLGIAVDILAMTLKIEWLGFGFPALRFIIAPAEQEVNAYYRRRYDEATEQWLNAKARGTAGDPQTLTLGLPGPSGVRVAVPAEVDPVELARIVKLGELAAGFNRPLKTLGVQEAMVTYFKVAMVLALIVSSPFVFYQMWAFIAAGLYPHERRQVYAFLPASLGLFFGGLAICQFMVMPAAVRTMLDFNAWSGVDPDLRLREWIGLAILLPVIFGLSFQAPLIMVFLTRIGVTSSQWYLRYWRQAVFGLALFVTVVTPTQDVITWSYLFVPLVALYLVGVGVSRLVEIRAATSKIRCDA